MIAADAAVHERAWVEQVREFRFERISTVAEAASFATDFRLRLADVLESCGTAGKHLE